MKWICIALMFAVVPSAVAKPRVYDHVGSVRWESNSYDAEAHVTVNGTTYDSYCATSTTQGVNCSDTAGAFYITLDNGKRYRFLMDLLGANSATDPIMEAHHVSKASPFNYRLTSPKHDIDPVSLRPSICVPYTSAKGKADEQCYILTPVTEVVPTPAK